jgi:hypothetical protein
MTLVNPVFQNSYSPCFSINNCTGYISPVLFLLVTILPPRVCNFRGSNYKFSLGWGISCILVTNLSYSDVATLKNSVTAVTASFVIPSYSFAVTQPFDTP